MQLQLLQEVLESTDWKIRNMDADRNRPDHASLQRRNSVRKSQNHSVVLGGGESNGVSRIQPSSESPIVLENGTESNENRPNGRRRNQLWRERSANENNSSYFLPEVSPLDESNDRHIPNELNECHGSDSTFPPSDVWHGSSLRNLMKGMIKRKVRS
jgi:hypothetical protein